MPKKQALNQKFHIEDYIYPLIFIIILIIGVIALWILFSPYIAIGVGALVSYIYFLRNRVGKDK